MRILTHPHLPEREGRELSFEFEGKTYTALAGDSIAAALLAAGVRTLRRSERGDRPRGIYCGIGHCFECRVYVLGVGSVRACITLVEDGMRVAQGRHGKTE